MQKMMREFLEFLYGDHKDQYIRYAHLQRKVDGSIIPKYYFAKDIEPLLKLHGKEDRYMSVALRKNNKVNTGAGVAFSRVLFVDLDFHDYSDPDPLKLKAVKALMNDHLLKQFSCIVDSGRGLHVYYKMPELLYKDEFETCQKRFIDYCFGVDFIAGCTDNNAKDISRILRLPGTINSKTGTTAKVMGRILDRCVDKDFMGMLKKDFSKQSGNRYSVAQAWELCGLGEIPVMDKNISCPFPGHEDTTPSFRYFSESDTFWCFKCSTQSKVGKLNGIHFLELMDRKELIPQLKEISEISNKTGYFMKEGGKICYRTQKKDKFICDFLSDKRIEAETFQRRVFIDLGEHAIEITDIPSNKDLKQRYLQAGKEFYMEESSAKLPDILIQFIKLSEISKRGVVFNPGLNKYADNSVTYYMNGRVYPNVEKEYIPVCDKIEHIIDSGRFNMDEFIDDLIADNNHTHIIGILWAIASTARDIFIKRKGMFPLFIATGVRESGKTMLGRLITSFFGYSKSEELDTTPFAMIKKLEAYGSLPIHFDEYGDKLKEKEHSELLKDISTSQVVVRERGTASQSTNKYFMQSPVIITGEKHIHDSGMVSRAIILNLGRNKHGDDDAFNRWSDKVIELETVKFMDRFLRRYWLKFREYINKSRHSRKRDMVKKDIIIQTLKFLEDNGLITKGKVKYTTLTTIIEATDKYKEAISADIYSEILADIFCHDYDPKNTKDNNNYVYLLDQAIYFCTDLGVVFINPTTMYQLYMDSIASKQYGMSRQSFAVAFHQSPDFIHVKDAKRRLYVTDFSTDKQIEKRNKCFMMSVSSFNREYLKVALMYKLQYNNDIEDVYDEAEKILSNMENKNTDNIDMNTSFYVI